MKPVPYAAILLAAAAPAAAGAVTIDLSVNGSVAPGSTSVYTISNDFDLPANFTNAVLTLSYVYLDDRGIVRLNGTTIDSTGIDTNGSLNGFLALTPGGSNDAFTYAGFNGARTISVTTGFVAGTNQFGFLVNDTNQGVQGAPLAGGVALSTFDIRGQVTYDLGPAAVPEPAAWAMMALGFGLVGTAARRRRPLLAA